MNHHLLTGIVIVLLIAAGIGIYTYQRNPETPPAPIEQVILDTSAWKEYKNEDYKFTFKYPLDWNLTSVEKSPISTQKRVSFIFRTLNPVETTVLFSVWLIHIDDWDAARSTGYYEPVGRDKEYILAVSLPSAYAFPREFLQEYKTLLTTFEF